MADTTISERIAKLREAWLDQGAVADKLALDYAGRAGADILQRTEVERRRVDDRWREYQDAIFQLQAAQAAEQSRTAETLTRTNVVLAGRQFWLAAAICAATIAQAVAAIFGACHGH